MKISTLRELHQADLSNEVVHFTGRQGPVNDEVDLDIRELDAPSKLARVLAERRLRAYRPFHGWGDPVVCFTEATQAGLARLVETDRYHAWGIGFSKNWCFQREGGPAFYVRGDLWDEFCAVTPPRVRAFGTKFWPGVEFELDEDADAVPATLHRPNEWAHEREWRVPRPESDSFLPFDYGDVTTLVVPDPEALEWLRSVVPHVALDHGRVVVMTSPGVKWAFRAAAR